MDITDELISLVESCADKSHLTADSPLDSLNLDSLEFVEMLHEAEQKFDVVIPDALIAGMNTIQDLANAINQLTCSRTHISA